MSSDFNINSVDRFRKRSSRLIFEQPAEVPAGCGGLVFRWVNPDDGLPVRFLSTCVGVREMYVNGQHVERLRTRVPFGLVILGFHIHSRNARNNFGMDYLFDWFSVAATHLTVGWNDEPMVDSLTTDTGLWLASTEYPGDDWNSHDCSFDGWTKLEPSQMDIEQVEEKHRRRFGLNDVQPLALPDADEVWVRKQTIL